MKRATIPMFVLVAVVTGLSAGDSQSAERPPAPKVEVLQPNRGETLAGTVRVRVRITPPEGARLPARVYVGLGGRPWWEMDKLNEANEWVANVDSSMAPNGPQALTVITDNKRVKATVEVTLKNRLKYYFADLHSHTGYSDGTLLPSIAHDYARNVANLDVFCLTDHLEHVDDAEWLDTREVAMQANEPGEFVVIPGLEWTKQWGHVNIFDPKTRHWPTDPGEFYQAAVAAGVILKFNHPGDGTRAHSGLEYSETADAVMQMMEVRRPEEELALIRALKLGWHIAPEGSDDTHSPNWGNVSSWTVILAPGLSQRCVWDALQKRHIYSTRDRNCLINFTINGAVMGDIIEQPAEILTIVAAFEEDDADDSIAKIELCEDGEVVETYEPGAATGPWTIQRKPEPGKHFYYARYTQADDDMIWSAPIWVTVAD